MNKSKIPVVLMGLSIIILIVMVSGCTFDPGSLINQKNVKTDDVIQFTVNIDESSNNSYHVNGLVENKVGQKYRFVNLTVIGYNSKKEIVSKTITMVPEVPAHDYADYDVWLNSSSNGKITSVKMKFINGTKG